MSGLRLSCPYGGTFFVCEHNTTEFIGCCTSDPCHDGRGTCSNENLRNSSFSHDSFAAIMPQDCSDSSASWYTCNFTSPPFLGCCKTDPCAAPCVSADLTPAKLSSDVAARSAFLTEPLSTSSQTSGALSTAPAATNATEPQQAPPSPEHFDGLSAPTIAGYSIAAAALVVLVAVCMYVWGRRSGKRAARQEPPTIEHNPENSVPGPQQAEVLHTDVRAKGHHDVALPSREWPGTVRTGSLHYRSLAPFPRADMLHHEVPTILIPGHINHNTMPEGVSTYQGRPIAQREDSPPDGPVYELSTLEGKLNRDPDELHFGRG